MFPDLPFILVNLRQEQGLKFFGALDGGRVCRSLLVGSQPLAGLDSPPPPPPGGWVGSGL